MQKRSHAYLPNTSLEQEENGEDDTDDNLRTKTKSNARTKEYVELHEMTSYESRSDLLEGDTLENVDADVMQPTDEDIAETVLFSKTDCCSACVTISGCRCTSSSTVGVSHRQHALVTDTRKFRIMYIYTCDPSQRDCLVAVKLLWGGGQVIKRWLHQTPVYPILCRCTRKNMYEDLCTCQPIIEFNRQLHGTPLHSRSHQHGQVLLYLCSCMNMPCNTAPHSNTRKHCYSGTR